MKRTFRTAPWAIAITLLLCSCTDKVVINGADRVVFRGTIFNVADHQPVADAQLRIDGREIRTGSDGRFAAPALTTGRNYVLQIEHDDFMSMTRSITFSDSSSDNDVSFTIIPRSEKQRFDAADSIILGFAGAGSIVIRPNTLVTAAGAKYSGTVTVRTAYVDPNDPRSLPASPGSLIAARGAERIPLQTFGMVEIVAVDTGGKRLDVADGSTVSIALPNVSQVTQSVGLYSLDAATGYWSEEGTLAVDERSKALIGEVTSISTAWNADQPCASALVCVRIQVVDVNGNPDPRWVATRGLSYSGYTGPTLTDNQGFVDLWVCPGQTFQILDDLIPCCDPGDIPGTTDYEFCCVNGGWVQGPIIDLSQVVMAPPCTFLGPVTF